MSFQLTTTQNFVCRFFLPKKNVNHVKSISLFIPCFQKKKRFNEIIGRINNINQTVTMVFRSKWPIGLRFVDVIFTQESTLNISIDILNSLLRGMSKFHVMHPCNISVGGS